jgi:hypothetical protein
MKNAVITAKLPSGKWEAIYISENITEAKKEFSRINSAEYTEDAKGYLQFNLFYQPQRRKVSKSGRISEHELKEEAKAKRAKEKAYEKQREEEEKAFQAELEAEEKQAKKDAKLIKDRQTSEKAAQVKEKIASGKLPKPAKKKEGK